MKRDRVADPERGARISFWRKRRNGLGGPITPAGLLVRRAKKKGPAESFEGRRNLGGRFGDWRRVERFSGYGVLPRTARARRVEDLNVGATDPELSSDQAVTGEPPTIELRFTVEVQVLA